MATKTQQEHIQFITNTVMDDMTDQCFELAQDSINTDLFKHDGEYETAVLALRDNLVSEVVRRMTNRV